jgi:hypothetical protein
MSMARPITVALFLALAGCKRTPPESTPPPSQQEPPRSNTAAATPDAASANAPPSDTAVAPPAADAEFRAAGRVLPRAETAGFRQSGAVIHSTGANLFQQIDGDAVSYQNYGVRDYAKTDYRKPGTKLVATVSIYGFEAPLGAFGRYSMHLSSGRDPASLEAQAVRIGAGGFQGRTQLVFVKESFLVQVDLADENEDVNESALFAAAREILPALARAAAANIPGSDNAPAAPLVADNLVWGGASYVSQNVLDVENSGPGWIGWYRTAENKRFRVALLTAANDNNARAAANRYRLRAASAVAGTTADEAFAVTLPTHGESVVARRGAFVAIATGSGIDASPAPATLDRAALTAAAIAQLDRSAPRR